MNSQQKIIKFQIAYDTVISSGISECFAIPTTIAFEIFKKEITALQTAYKNQNLIVRYEICLTISQRLLSLRKLASSNAFDVKEALSKFSRLLASEMLILTELIQQQDYIEKALA